MELALDLGAIAVYQRDLAQKALSGDNNALLLLGRNHGCNTWRGTIDAVAAMRVAELIIAGVLYPEQG